MTYQFKVGHMVKVKNGPSTITWTKIRAHSYEKAVEAGKRKYGDNYYDTQNPHTDGPYGETWASDRTRGCWR